MQNLASKTPRTLRVFRVGILGTSVMEMEIIERIFSVTQYRARRYQPVRLPPTIPRIPDDVDIVILAQNAPGTPKYYETSTSTGSKVKRPIVSMVRNWTSGEEGRGYTIKMPVNPAKFLRMLDQYTIRELNYLPEFEIGHEGDSVAGVAADGLRLMRHKSRTQERNNKSFSNISLVVDDSLAVRNQMQIEFELINQPVHLVDSAEAAMRAVEVNRYSVIFLDVVMPGMDGYAACKKIKRTPLNRNTPVILLTSRSSSFDKFKGTLAGCDAYLVKPINHNEFEQVYGKFTQQDNGEKHNGSK